MNYSTLVQDIQDWTENNESVFVSQIDTFIDFAELRILRETDLNVARKYASSTLTQDVTFLSVPSDMVVLRSLQTVVGDTRTFLQQKEPSFLNEFIVDRTATGSPRYYAHYDQDALSVVPAPASDTLVELAYTYRITGLSAANTTNWIGDNAPSALLYACLIEANIFMKGEAGLTQNYTQKYQEALQALLAEQNVRNRRDEYRAGVIEVNLG